MTARVLAFIAALKLSGSIVRLLESMSEKTGTASRNATAFAVDGNVKDGTMTSSPGPMPAKAHAISKAAVPDGVSMAPALPHRSVIIASQMEE
jgi:hypothetical protein